MPVQLEKSHTKLRYFEDMAGIGLGDISHTILMHISSVKPVLWLAVNLHHLFSDGAAFNTRSRSFSRALKFHQAYLPKEQSPLPCGKRTSKKPQSMCAKASSEELIHSSNSEAMEGLQKHNRAT